MTGRNLAIAHGEKVNQKLTNSRGDPPQKMQQLVIPICNCPFITIPMIVERANLFIPYMDAMENILPKFF